MIDLRDPGDGVPCLKHDVAYGTLQRIVADTPGTEGNTLDAAWNPRNKYLADRIMLIDAICGVQTGQARRDCIPAAASDHGFWEFLHRYLWTDDDAWSSAKLQHAAVSLLNSKEWPVTSRDVDHAKTNEQYLSCAAPGISGTPTVSHTAGQTFRLSWNPSPSGCAPVRSTYKFCFQVLFEAFQTVLPYCHDFGVSDSQTSATISFALPRLMTGWRAVRMETLEIFPSNRVQPLNATSYPTVRFPNAQWTYRSDGVLN